MAELAGQVAVVTGGSGAIGGAIVQALAGAGATAYSLDLAPPQGRTPYVQCDVRQEASVAAAVEQVSQQHGRLDIAVHAAGISRDAVLWKLTADEWDTVQAVNLRGAFLLLRSAIPHMRRNKSGRAVLIGSINGSRGKFGTAAYSASKAGLIGMAKSVAREVGRFGVLVNVVEPGWVRTPLTEKVPQEVRDAALAESLVGSFLDPEDIAGAVLYLCGPAGKRVTGQVLRVDGGQFLGPT
ncbi:MAG: SDR family oxidoreductase [Candidatus Koribacter versatilis]|uniref:SDR family oxidoreductase n=1 Tax=Candidatus Korobacter versatilis TaxID=658062 RepID=A0A932A9G4_9BACT|nr:SDR family oxidoreductase [Candidatus Koribacter versatilis]